MKIRLHNTTLDINEIAYGTVCYRALKLASVLAFPVIIYSVFTLGDNQVVHDRKSLPTYQQRKSSRNASALDDSTLKRVSRQSTSSTAVPIKSIAAFPEDFPDLSEAKSEDDEQQHTSPETSPSIPPQFHLPPYTEDLQCNLLFQSNDEPYLHNLTLTRLTFSDEKLPDDFPMDCNSIRARNFFLTDALTEEEAKYPLAFATHDYMFIELTLAAMYQPQNWYCYSIDMKSPLIFHERVRSLAQCFPNVIISPRTRDTDRLGHNLDDAHMDCLLLLLNRTWEYVVYLENHDSPLKTNYEMVKIYKWMNGANDMIMRTDFNHRQNKQLDWTFKGLDLFKDHRRHVKVAKRARAVGQKLPAKYRFSMGLAEISLSHRFVDWMINEINIRKLMDVMNERTRYAAEHTIQSLNSHDALEAPGGFTQKCHYATNHYSSITRYTLWEPEGNCSTNHYRHNICVQGVENLEPVLPHLPYLFINKMMPEFDYAAVVCWYSYLFNRTHLEPPASSLLNEADYTSRAHVRFQSLRDHYGRISPKRLKEFQCKLKDKKS